MPTLLDLQHAMHRSLLRRDDTGILPFIIPDALAPAARLNIYRNNVLVGLTRALSLGFPAVERLVGHEFFETAAAIFIANTPPAIAWLDRYGAEFPAFLADFAPAASLPYLPGVARLEWAVSQALHAEDAPPLDLPALQAIPPEHQGALVLQPHPSVALVEADYPVDLIWRAVLDRDDATLAAINFADGPLRLIVHRGPDGIAVFRCDAGAFDFAAALFAGRPLDEACALVPAEEAVLLLGAHIGAGRFSGFSLQPDASAA